ncbi:MAG: adenylate/guanylate cyclase domain-containing protein [Candidatus Latescibacteria bacterium]|nr:adenylate/guanylate cyclase domain-containing protein [Candidatus Latescibacterota bacterium]
MPQHQLAAILFTDMVGYTEVMEQDEQLARRLVLRQREVLFPCVERHSGTVIRELGDGFLVMFGSTVEAVRCALDTQAALKDEHRLALRMGIHLGDVVLGEGSLQGLGVNVAARLQALATPRSIYISADVWRQIKSQVDLTATSLGFYSLKGVSEPIEVYEVKARGPDALPALRAHRRAGQNPYLNRVAVRDRRDFFGRTRELTRLFHRLNASLPQSISIVGERRIGKSSFLHHLTDPDTQRLYLNDPQRYLFLLLDLQERRQTTVENFFRFVYDELAKISNPVHVDQPATYEGFRSMVASLTQGHQRLVFLLDEFEIIGTNPKFDRAFFDFLRGLANNNDVAYLIASGVHLQRLCASGKIASSPFFNIFWHLPLGPFQVEEARTLIAEPSAAAGYPLASYTDVLLDVGGFFPFFLQIACSVAFELLLETPERLNEDSFMETCWDEMQPHFAFIWQSLSDDERTVCRELATASPGKPRSPALREIKRKGYVVEETGQPRLFSRLFMEFVQQAG